MIDFEINVTENQYSEFHQGLLNFFSRPLTTETMHIIEDLKNGVVAQQELSQKLLE